jgi:hypothetical protein
MTRTKLVMISIGATVALALVLVPTASAVRDYSSPNAILHGGGVVAESSSATPVHSSPAAILGARNLTSPATTPAVVIQSSQSSGFDWGDALIGAGSALGLIALVSGVVALTRRRRRLSIQPTPSN